MKLSLKDYEQDNIYSIKFLVNDETRRVSVRKAELESYAALEKLVLDIAKDLEGKTLTISWKDEEDDVVRIASDREFFEAVNQQTIRGSSLLRFVVTGREIPQNKKTTPPSTAVHRGVTCDECGMYPIVGPRFKCAVRDDFDLCAQCEARQEQPHAMLKIARPDQVPAVFFVAMEDAEPQPQCTFVHSARASTAVPSSSAPAPVAEPTPTPAPAPAAPEPEPAPASAPQPTQLTQPTQPKQKKNKHPASKDASAAAPAPAPVPVPAPQPTQKKHKNPFFSGHLGHPGRGLPRGPANQPHRQRGGPRIDRPHPQPQPTVQPHKGFAQTHPFEASVRAPFMEMMDRFLYEDKFEKVTPQEQQKKGASEWATYLESMERMLHADALEKKNSLLANPAVFESESTSETEEEEEDEEPLPKMEVLESPISSEPAVRPMDCVEKVWKVRNAGNTTWPEGCVARYMRNGEAMGDVELPELMPGEYATVRATFIAPMEVGDWIVSMSVMTADKRVFGVLIAEMKIADESVNEDKTYSDDWDVLVDSATEDEDGDKKEDEEEDEDDSVAIATPDMLPAAAMSTSQASSAQSDLCEKHTFRLLWREELSVLEEMGFGDLDLDVLAPLVEEHLVTPLVLRGAGERVDTERMQSLITALLML